MRNYRICQECLVALFIGLGFVASTLHAQPGLLGGGGPLLGQGDRVPKLEAGISVPDKNNVAQLYIVATMPEGAHTYSITQPDGGPNRTRIKIGPTTDVPAIDGFHTVNAATIKPPSDDTFPVPQEEHYGSVKWFAPIHLAPGTKPDAIRLEGKVSMQLCDDNGCLPPKDYPFTATYHPEVAAEKLPEAKPASSKPTTPPASPAPLTSPAPTTKPVTPPPSTHTTSTPTDVTPKLEAGYTMPKADGSAQLFITVTLSPRINTYSITQLPGGPTPSTIKIEPADGLPEIGKFAAVVQPNVVFNASAFPGLPLEEQTGTFTWIAPLQFAPGSQPTSVIRGSVRMQLCEENVGCFPAKDFPFTAALNSQIAAIPLPGSDANKPNEGGAQVKSAQPVHPAKRHGDLIKWRRFTNISDLHDLVGGNLDPGAIKASVKGDESSMSVWGAVVAGFIGGLILNIMPCVLPVIGLKILSFVEQSGHSRAKAFGLNLWYSAGLLSVFLILASLAVGPQKLGWGQLFGETWFTITLTVVVFVMGLSFMGLWEFPLPAFLGSGKAGALASQEGAAGAYFKGALTTLLATPCSAPFLASALVWATAQPPWLTYLVFASIGIGMASPYLLVGAFPELLRFLPKPGPWMETFKQAMGFILLGTVVYLLTVLEPYHVIPTVGLLFALWFACWWIGRLDPLADSWKKLRAWSLSIAFCGAVWIVMFPGMPQETLLGKYAFSGLSKIMQQRLGMEEDEELDPMSELGGPRIVLIDFTADWCVTCHQKESSVLQTPEVANAVQRFNVGTVKADWSHKEKAREVTKMLDLLGSRQIPVIAIFSPAHPNHPKVFRGGYTQQDILAALDEANTPMAPSPNAQVAARLP